MVASLLIAALIGLLAGALCTISDRTKPYAGIVAVVVAVIVFAVRSGFTA